MRHIQTLLIFMILTVVSCKKQTGWDVTIRGQVGFPQKGEIRIAEMQQDKKNAFEDTIQLKSDYTFEKKLHLTEPGYYQLNFYNKQFVNFILDTSKLQINVDGNSPSGFSQVKGSPDQDLIEKVQLIMREGYNNPYVKTLENYIQDAARDNDQAKLLENQQKYQTTLDTIAYGPAAKYILQQPPSLGLLNIMQNAGLLDRDKYFNVYSEVADKFKKAGFSYAKEFVEGVEKQKKLAIGQPAPEISLPDPGGKVVALSSFRGKFVLVDFWAKWCGPCRQENPNVVRAYLRFKDKGFDVLGVSLDRTKEDWTKAIQEDGLVWTQVSDLKYFDSQAAKDYNVNAIPFSILVDPTGVIIARNLRGSALEKKLDEVLNKKL